MTNKSFITIYRFLFRIRYWLIIVPAISAIIAAMATRNMSKSYESNMVIFTGIVSGSNVENIGSNSEANWVEANNALDNILNIMSSRGTLEEVSLRLFAQNMIYGNPDKDNEYISAKNARELFASTPDDVIRLIDKSSIEKTLENLEYYKSKDFKNHVAGLFNYFHRHYSYNSLSNNIKIHRKESSDMIQVTYACDDPSIAYNTLKLLNQVFIRNYENMRYGITSNIINYFQQSLDSIALRLRYSEDTLTQYSIDKKVINFPEQTKFLASLKRDYALIYEEALRNYNSTEESLKLLEAKIAKNVENVKNNAAFVAKLKEISELSSKTSDYNIRPYDQDDFDYTNNKTQKEYKDRLTASEKELKNVALSLVENQTSTDGVSTELVLNQWLEALVKNNKSKSELKSIESIILDLNKEFSIYAPVGSTLSRKERNIKFLEQSYSNILNALNSAKLREKDLRMTASILKTISPPLYPTNNAPTKRKAIVAITGLCSFIFILSCFIVIELLDRTLQNKEKAERITGGTVIGAISAKSRFTNRSYNKQRKDIEAKYMVNLLNGYLKPDGLNIINIISSQKGDGKSYLSAMLQNIWEEYGMKVKLIKVGTDFMGNDRNYYLAKNIEDFYSPKDEDILIIEHAPLRRESIPYMLLSNSTLNIWVARADRTWIERDQMILDRLTTQTHTQELLAKDLNNKQWHTPTVLYLNRADKYSTEGFVGMLPPRTLLTKLSYRLYNIGLVSNE